MTCKIEHVSLTQYISAAPLHTQGGAMDHSNTWLESGGITVGPIDAEAAMALPNPDYHEIQDQFLKVHDGKTKRLWFIWPPDPNNVNPSVIGKCGCHGGCSFFGKNKNGIGFFNPRKTKEMPYAAVLQISPEGHDPGFGQSLLFADKLLFEVTPTCGRLSPMGKAFHFTRGYMSDIASPDSLHKTCVHMRKDVNNTSSSIPTDTSARSTVDSMSTIKSNTSEVRFNLAPSEVFKFPSGAEIATSPPSSSLQSSRKRSFDESAVNSLQVKAKVNDNSIDPTRFSGSPSSVHRIPSPKHMLQQHDDLRSFSIASLESEKYYSAEDDNDVSTLKPNTEIPWSRTNDDTLRPNSDKPWFRTNDEFDTSDGTLKLGDVSIEVANETVIKQSESDSTISYESATSENTGSETETDSMSDEGQDFPDNLSLIDLHSQVNKPISESPVLLASYSRHLSQLQCHDWHVPSPDQSTKSGFKHDPSMFSLSSAGQTMQYIHSPACVPHFIRIKQGFHTSQMKTLEQDNIGQETPMYSNESKQQQQKQPPDTKPGRKV